jgi:CRP/FNR family transcriptional regulator, nitrogen oxide reductase regulator
VTCSCKLSPGKQVLGLPDRLKPRFLAGLSKAELTSILSAARHQRLRRSSVVVHEGDPAERLFLLTSGHGRHFVTTGAGRKILLHWLTAGQIFGGTALLSTPFRYLASTELQNDGCALVWERQVLRDCLSRYPTLIDNTLSIAVTEYIAWWVATQISLTSSDARGRVAHLIVSLACGIGKSVPDGIELNVTNEDLAAGANVTPFTVSRTLNEWQRAGILTKGRGKVVLRNPNLLATSVVTTLG